MSTMVLSHDKWKKIQQKIIADYGVTVGIISWDLKRTLGFTVRYHKGYSVWKKRYEDDIRLDFVNQDACTFFQLKYL